MPYLIDPVLDSARFAGPQPEVHGRDLVLRRWIPSDAHQLFSAYEDAAIRRWNLRGLDDLDEARQLIRTWKFGWRKHEAASWAVVRRTDRDRVLGQVGFRSLYLMDGMAEVSYWVMPGQRRLGVASRATQILSDWAIGEFGLHRLELVHSTKNAGSCQVARNANFIVEGVKRELQRHADGWHDMCLHSRIDGQQGRRATDLITATLPARLARSGVGGRSVGLQVAALTAARG